MNPYEGVLETKIFRGFNILPNHESRIKSGVERQLIITEYGLTPLRFTFLVAYKRPYIRVCPPVGRSVMRVLTAEFKPKK